MIHVPYNVLPLRQAKFVSADESCEEELCQSDKRDETRPAHTNVIKKLTDGEKREFETAEGASQSAT